MKRIILFVALMAGCLAFGRVHAQQTRLFSVMSYGAAGTNTSRTIGSVFTTLSAAQAAYPTLLLGQVYYLNITNPGSGYTSAPTVTISGGGGSGATATAVIQADGVSHTTLSSGGTGYTYPPTVTISGSGCTSVSAIADIFGGVVRNVRITNKGTGCTGTPSVTFTGGDGSGAAATAVVGGLLNLTITAAGTGYTSAPTVSFSGGAGSGATATAFAYDLNSEMDWAAIQAGSDAAAATGSGGTVYFPAGTYRINRTIEVNRTGAIRNISWIGEGRLATRLDWYGQSVVPYYTPIQNGPVNPAMPMVKFNLNKRWDCRGLLFSNKVTARTSMGILMTGPNPGTQTTNNVWVNTEIIDFDIGIQLGDPINGVSSSEITMTTMVISNCLIGMFAAGGNTEDFTLLQFEGSFNSRFFLTSGANNVHVHGGSASFNGIDFTWGTNGNFTLSGFRTETAGRFLSANTGTVLVEECHIGNVQAGDRQSITSNGGPFLLTFLNNDIDGFLGIHMGTAAAQTSSVVMINNKIFNDGALVPYPITPIFGQSSNPLNNVYITLIGNRQYGRTNPNLQIGAMPDRWGRMSGSSPVASVDYINIDQTANTFTLTRPLYTDTLFAALGTPSNSQTTYCSDCQPTSASSNVCAGSGSGAVAVRIAGAWRCFSTQAGGVSGTPATTGNTAFWNASTTISGENAFHWDATNDRLSIGFGTSPGVPLHVLADSSNNGVRVKANAASIDNNLTADGTQGIVGTSTNHALQLFANNAVAVHIDGGSNRFVGIGTVTPSNPLDLRGSSAGALLKLQNNDATGYSAIDVFNSSASQRAGIGVGNASAAAPLAGNLYLSGLNGSEIVLLTGAAGTGTERVRVNALGFLIAPVAFASLGTPANGTVTYCNDCTIANPCAGSGTGAIAKRLNGVWVCN